MRRKLSLITMLVAWLLATGSHWDLVQTYAWGRMIATYSQSMSISEAIRLTFTPDNLCGVCESVSEAKQQQDATMPSDGKLFGKIPMVFEAQAMLVGEVPARPSWLMEDLSPRMRDLSPPPVPPPRGNV